MKLLPGRWRRAASLIAAIGAFEASAQEACVACHGPGGNSIIAGIPSIAGQPKLFIENQLVLIREELRASPQMLPVVKGMKDAEITRLADHFSKLAAQRTTTDELDRGLDQRGAERAQALRCGVCHLPDYSGQKHVPRLASQREEYLVAEMQAYRDNKRTGGDTIMAAALYGVSDQDIRALAHFLSRLTNKKAAQSSGLRKG